MISKSAATAMMAATAVPAIFRALMSIFHLARPSLRQGLSSSLSRNGEAAQSRQN
jgi:hypothetical protein